MLFNPDRHISYEMLHDTKNTKIVFCYECQAFHIHYGTIALDLKKTGVATLIESLRLNLKVHAAAVAPDIRCVEICTPFYGIRLRFSLNELREFIGILQSSMTLLDQRIWQSRCN